MSYFTYSFEGPIVHHDIGSDKYQYTVVFLPRELQTELPLKQYPRLRIEAEVGEFPLNGALQPVRGDWYLLLSKSMLKQGGWKLGDDVRVRFRVADQDAVEVPEALQDALDGNEDAAEAWEKLTPGKRRGLAYRVATAKTQPTREKRVAEVLETLAEL